MMAKMYIQTAYVPVPDSVGANDGLEEGVAVG